MCIKLTVGLTLSVTSVVTAKNSKRLYCITLLSVERQTYGLNISSQVHELDNRKSRSDRNFGVMDTCFQFTPGFDFRRWNRAH